MSGNATKTLIVTNDFPPRPGGIQSFVHNLAIRRPAGSVVVYAPAWKRAAEFDAAQPFPVVRHPTSLMLPEPRVLRRAHGVEAGWAQLPMAARLLRRIGEGVDVMTYLGEYTRARMARALSDAAVARMARLAPGVDATVFRPGAGGAEVRARLGLAGRPVVVCVSRLVPRKGQDTLIRGWPRVLRAVPGAALLLVGGGPYRRTLERLAAETGVAETVRFTGSVPWERLPAHYAAGDVFAMPCRTRRRGLDVEGLGIVYLEASSAGLPVIAGDSGGAPDAVLAGETGLVVDGRSVAVVADAVISLLGDSQRAAAVGEKGRAG